MAQDIREEVTKEVTEAVTRTISEDINGVTPGIRYIIILYQESFYVVKDKGLEE